MLKVWIVGANGQIGHALNNVLDPLEMEVLNTDLRESCRCDHQLCRYHRYRGM